MALILYKWFATLALFLGSNVTSSPSAPVAHPFYVSVTEINHNATDKTLEISCKIFTEDLENALNKRSKVKVDLSNPKNKEEVTKLLGEYIAAHLQLRVNGGAALKLEILGFEHENEAVWTYLQVSNIPAVKRMDVNDSILYDSYEEQINLLHVTVGGNRKSTKLNNPEMAAKFDF